MNTDNRPNMLDDAEIKRIRNMDPRELYTEAEKAKARHSAILNAAYNKEINDYKFENVSGDVANGRSGSELEQEAVRLLDFVNAADQQLEAHANKNRHEDLMRRKLTNPNQFTPEVMVRNDSDIALAGGILGRAMAMGGVTTTGEKVAGEDAIKAIHDLPNGAGIDLMGFGGMGSILNTSRTGANNTMEVDTPLTRQGVTMLHDDVIGVADRLQVLNIPKGTDTYTFRQENASSQTFPTDPTISEGGALDSGTGPSEQSFAEQMISVQAKKLGCFVTYTNEMVTDNIGWLQWMNSRLRENLRQLIEKQVITGSGSGGHWKGLNNQGSGNIIVGMARQASGSGNAYHGLLDHIRHFGKFAMFKEINRMPSFIAMNSDTLDELLNEKDEEGRHYLPIDTRTGGIPKVWGMDVVVSQKIADHKMLMVYAPDVAIVQKQGIRLDVGLNGDDLKNGTRTVVATLRGNVITIRPKAILRLDTRVNSDGDDA